MGRGIMGIRGRRGGGGRRGSCIDLFEAFIVKG